MYYVINKTIVDAIKMNRKNNVNSARILNFIENLFEYTEEN